VDTPAAERLVGESRAMVRLEEQLRRFARSAGRNVLVAGEDGSGRTLLARVLHRAAPWGGTAPFRETVPEVLEADLALEPRGTLLVRHLDEPSAAAQEAMRRHFSGTGGGPGGGVLVGRVATVPEGIGAGAGVEVLRVPPLREREGDLALLVDHFLRGLNREHARRVTGITRGALAHLERHDWPGNVRELRATLEGMVVFAEGRRPLDVSDLPLRLRERARADGQNVTLSLDISLAEAEKSFLEETLRAVGYDRPRAAETLGIGLRTLYRKLKEYEIG
jgi:DNA-binding NtrC family response regulator